MKKNIILFLITILFGVSTTFAQHHKKNNFSSFNNNSANFQNEPTLRCFQNGKQVLQETGQFVSNKQSGKNIYKFGDSVGGINILVFDLGDSICTLTKLAK